jgi:hypothetical protein
MNIETEIEFWKSSFEDRGVSSHLINDYLIYCQKILTNNVPVVFELEHLSKLLGTDYIVLCKMVNSPTAFYRRFLIPKRRGGFREITAPYPSLLSCQNWIYENILKSGRVHPAVHGFALKKSILTNASPHLNSTALLKLDIENFFPSLSINWVLNYFSSLGYARNISFYLASLCCFDGGLTQGASTSPALSNILLYGLDVRLELLAEKYELRYTRYADDMTFSGNYIPHNFIQIVSGIIDDFGLNVNEGKTRLHTKKGQRIVTGISVTGDEPKLPKSKKRELRQKIHIIRKYGYMSYISKKKINEPNYLLSLLGQIQFWLQVEPNNIFAQEGLAYLKSINRQI